MRWHHWLVGITVAIVTIIVVVANVDSLRGHGSPTQPKPVETFMDSATLAGMLFPAAANERDGQPRILTGGNGGTIPTTTIGTALNLPALRPGSIGGRNTKINPNTVFIDTAQARADLTAQQNQCRTIAKPSDIVRTGSSMFGCGWLMPPGNASGVGALGIEQEPAFPEDRLKLTESGYTWVWDPTYAQYLEDVRRCARVGSCTSLLSGCGWCTATNRAIPINVDGSVKYPGAQGAPCASIPIGSAAQCPVAPIPAPITGPGAPSPAAVAAIRATPNPDGSCTGGCIQAQIVAAGCSPQGALATALIGNQLVAPLPATRDLVGRAFMINSNILADGTVTQSQALTELTQLATGRQSRDVVVRGAAENLCVGGPYDVCTAATASGIAPSRECLSQVWAATGCGVSGESAPVVAPTAWTSVATVSAARAMASQMYNAMFSNDMTAQTAAIHQCLGTSVVHDLPAPCREPGVEIIYFTYTPGSTVSTPGPLLGREITTAGIPTINNAADAPVMNSGASSNVQVRMLTGVVAPYTSAGQGGTFDLQCRATNGMAVAVNGVAIINSWATQPVQTIVRSQALTVSSTPAALQLDWFQPFGPAIEQLTIGQSGAFQAISPAWLVLQQPSTAPFLVWKFHNNTTTESRNLVPTTAAQSAQIGPATNGAMGMTFSPGQSLTLGMPPLTQLTAYTMTVWMEATQPVTGAYVPVLVLGQQSAGQFWLGFTAGSNGVASQWTASFATPGAPTATYSVSVSGATGKWSRVVFVVADDSRSAMLYVDNQSAQLVAPMGCTARPTVGYIGKNPLLPSQPAMRVASFAFYDLAVVAATLLASGPE